MSLSELETVRIETPILVVPFDSIFHLKLFSRRAATPERPRRVQRFRPILPGEYAGLSFEHASTLAFHSARDATRRTGSPRKSGERPQADRRG